MDKTYRPSERFEDGIDRAAIGIFLRLSKNQVEGLGHLAEAAGKPWKDYLRDIGEAAIEQRIPAK